MNNQANDFNLDDLLKEFQLKERPDAGEETMVSIAAPPSEIPEPLFPADEESEPDKPSDSSFTNDIEFDIKFRGYDRLQVDHYIDALTEDYNAICEKCDTLEKENQGLRKALADLNREAVT